jgi:glycosyltransferase involved in cell wall biosynthesis
MGLKKKIRILMYSTASFPFDTGGVANIAYFLTREFAKKILYVGLVFKIRAKTREADVNRYLKGNRFRNLEIIPIKDISLDKKRRSPIKVAIFRTIKLFFKQIRPILSKNYDILHLNSIGLSEFSFLYPLLAKLRGKKIVFTCHNYNLIGSKNFLEGGSFYNLSKAVSTKIFKILIYVSILIFRASWKFYDLKTIYSSTLSEIIKKEKLSGKNVRVIPNGIDLNLFKDVPKIALDGNPSILYVGLYSKIKGVDLALQAFEIIERHIPTAKLYLVGSGSDVDVPNLIKSLKIKNVKNLGILSHKKTLSYTKSADLCLFPYRSKSFGITLLEALAAEKTVVIPNINDFKELIKDNVNGILVPLDSNEIGQRVVSLWENEELRTRIASNTKAIINKYSWSSIADKYVNCYYQLLNFTEKR